MENLERTIGSQYGNSPTLLQLIDSMNQYFDPKVNFQAFIDYVWNVDTAIGFGLDILGRIVNVGRDLTVPNPNFDPFGFAEAGAQPFDQAPFYDGQPMTITYSLADTAYRQLILTKALSNISNCSAPSINQQLRNLFPDRGRCYVSDNLDMTMRFTFEFELEPFELAILLQSNAITRPAAVELTIISLPTKSFGFAEGKAQPFDVGTFYNS